MSNLLQLWREVCERSPALVNPQGKHLIVSESDCMLIGCEIERACLPPAPPSIVETLAVPDNKTVTFDALRALADRIEEADGAPISIATEAANVLRKLAAAPTPAAQSASLTDERIDWIANSHCPDNVARPSNVKAAIREALAEAAQSAGQEAVAANFACYLIDHCEGETVTEELVQLWLTRMLADPQYAAPANASEPVGVAGTMPGTEGFTMACFEAAKVPVGTSLYAAPVNGGDSERILREFGNFEHPDERAADAPQVNGGERCVCGQPTTLGTVHRTDGPCYVADAQQVGAALLPKYTEWVHLRTHGQWSDGVPAWARDHSGRMNDFAAALAVISELYDALTSPAKEQK